MKLAACGNEPEIFSSVQGEGKSAGIPSVFIRSSLCNLHCWWCDTDYTWNWKESRFPHKNDSNPDYSGYRRSSEIIDCDIDAIVNRVSQFAPRNVVCTGGEPLLHDSDWVTLCGTLREKDPSYKFEFETNGTLLPSDALVALVEHFTVSPKLENSRVANRLRVREDALRQFSLMKNAYFKFVIASDKDCDEVRALCETYRIVPDRVYVMPEGTTAVELDKNMPIATRASEEFGFLLSDRLHIRQFGNRRGV